MKKYLVVLPNRHGTHVYIVENIKHPEIPFIEQMLDLRHIFSDAGRGTQELYHVNLTTIGYTTNNVSIIEYKHAEELTTPYLELMIYKHKEKIKKIKKELTILI